MQNFPSLEQELVFDAYILTKQGKTQAINHRSRSLGQSESYLCVVKALSQDERFRARVMRDYNFMCMKGTIRKFFLRHKLKIYNLNGQANASEESSYSVNTCTEPVNFLGLEVFLAPPTAWAALNQPRTPEN